MKERLAYILIVFSVLLLILNMITSDFAELDRGFYFRVASNIILIFAMLLSVNHRKNKEKG